MPIGERAASELLDGVMAAAQGMLRWSADLLGRALLPLDEAVGIEGACAAGADAASGPAEGVDYAGIEEALRRSLMLVDGLSDAQAQFIGDADPKGLFAKLLETLLALTDSEYGFIGEVLHGADGKPYLKTHAITDISWNAETRRFYAENAASGLEFRNLSTLFGRVLTTGRPVLANAPGTDPRRGGLPPGHPPLDAFLGLPFYSGTELVGMVGIANRTGGYDAELASYLQPMLRTCATGIQSLRSEQRRRRAEEELVLARDKAVEATRLKSEFLATVSHEIRTPMNAIFGMMDLLLETELSTEQLDYAETVRRNAEGLLGILNDILDFSKIEAGRLELDNRMFDLRALVADTVRLLAPSAARKQLDLGWNVIDWVPEAVVGDPGRLRQVLLNIIGNAIKFTDAGRVDVRVAVGSRTDRELEVVITVADTGIGIAPDRRDMIFEPFAQADGSTSRRFGGTGLGLAISSQLVEMMRGRIWVDSEVDVGTTIHFVVRLGLPVAAEQALQPITV